MSTAQKQLHTLEIEGLPFDQIERRKNALVVPFRRGSRQGRAWPSGVFDADGTPSPHAQMEIMTRRAEISPDLFEDALPDAAHLTGEWLFCGLGSEQFGHIISRGLGRLWALDNLPPDVRLLFCGINTSKRKHGFLRDLLKSLGLPNKHFILKGPATVEELYLAPDLFGEHLQGAASPEYAAWIRGRIPKPDRTGRRVYLTRTRVDPKLGRILCEVVLEENLSKAGFEIIAPETLSVSEQLSLYSEADVVVASEGSALHVVPLALRHDARLVVIQRRKKIPELIANQIASFTRAECSYLDVLVKSHWPKERADNLSLGEIDFAKVRNCLVELNLVNEKIEWREPTPGDVLVSRGLGRPEGTKFLTDDERDEYLRKIREANRSKRFTMNTKVAERPIPVIDGLRYFRLLNRIHAKLQPKWYLEVGTFTGKSLAMAKCNTVAVDPNFKIEHPVINAEGSQMFFFQQTSDDFFASGFLKANKIKPDFAFLDGMHLFEFLLRDFIAAEKAMGKGGVICLHDCCPTTAYMAEREFHDGMWTGDVWKTLMILLKHRPDLRIDVTDAASTGLVVIRNLDPRSKVLEANYDDLVDEYMDQSLDDLEGGIGGLYSHFKLVSPEELLETL